MYLYFTPLILCVSFYVRNSDTSYIKHDTEINNIENSEYYWRDYNDVIPTDAIPGGFDKSGSPTYIGQMAYRGPRLLPATIYRGCDTAYSTVYGKEVSDDTYIKILCSRNLNMYSWIPTRYEDLHLLTSCHLVVGGMEKGHTLYIGRVYHDRKTRIGKIFDSHSSNEGLAIPYRGKEMNFMSFEILTYNCTLSDLCNVIAIASD